MSEVSEKTISKDMTIDEMFAQFPQKAQKLAFILTKYGLQCVGCSASTWETIEAGAFKHGFSEEMLLKLLAELNNIILEEASDPSVVTLTKQAAEKFQAIAEAEGKKGCALRFDEVPRGCSGFEYVLDFSDKADDEHDVIFHSEGVEIHVFKKSLHRLVGCNIHYVDGLHAGFQITNPNADSSCACGSSHGYS